jgi:hypothetical protein
MDLTRLTRTSIFPTPKKVYMYRILIFALGGFLSGLQPAFSQTAPVQYLAGKSETGQPHLYWFGAAAVESTLYYDDGTAEWPDIVNSQWADNQVLVRFGMSAPVYLVSEFGVYLFDEPPSESLSTFAFSIRKDTGGLRPGPFLAIDTFDVLWDGHNSVFAQKAIYALMVGDTSFWGAFHWMSDSPTNPSIGEDRSGNSGRNYVGYNDSFFVWKDGGNRIIQTSVMINKPTVEMADSLWIYRSDGFSFSHIATAGSEQFDYLDSPPGAGDYDYRVTRWRGSVESPPSNPIRLTASPTAVEDRQIEKHAFLLSEPFPNPTSTGVLFTARTDKQLELGFSIYNLLGQKVFSKTLLNYPAGEHQFFWNGQDASGRRLPSGMYLLRFQAGEEVLVKKITLLR